MTKTPEEMAEEYRENHDECEFARDAFLAGYQAAKDEYKVAIDTYNDVAMQILEEAVRIMSPKDQLADADKVMCSTTTEEIKAVDTGELMPITNLPTSAKWISVKERLPELGIHVLTYGIYTKDTIVAWRDDCDELLGMYDWVTEDRLLSQITHWMPLPAPPEEEK